jgi:hypothetical protein
MIFNKMDIRTHFEFRIAVIDPDYDMIVCMPNGTYLKKNREDSLITDKNSTVFAERYNLDEKTGLKVEIIPLSIEIARVYVECFNKVRKKMGWESLEFEVLAEENV